MLENDEVQGRCPKCRRLRLFGGNPPRKICPACDLTAKDGIDAPKSGLVNTEPVPTEKEFLEAKPDPKRLKEGLSLIVDKLEAQTDKAQMGIAYSPDYVIMKIPKSVLSKLHDVVDKERRKEKDLTKLNKYITLLLEIEKEQGESK